MDDQMQGGDEGIVTCPTCQQMFASQEELVAHMKQAHGDDPVEGEGMGDEV
jgi:uncharacterized C2H2 Zn-finger protein